MTIDSNFTFEKNVNELCKKLAGYLALIRLQFVELDFRQIKIKYIQCNTIQYL